MKQRLSFIILYIFFIALVVSGHNDNHVVKADSGSQRHIVNENSNMAASTNHNGNNQNISLGMMKADFEEFPTLHPLVVHFPIVLILLSLVSQLLGLFYLKTEMSWVTLVLLVLGFVGVLVASLFVHPHTTQLPPVPHWLLEQHEKFADLTLYTSLFALLLKIVSHFFLRRKIWIELLVAISLGLSSWFIGTASHYGAQLTHIEGIGPQGNYLETPSAEHTHTH